MTVTAARAPGTSAPGSQTVGGSSSDAARTEVLRLAQEFEAMLMTQMLRDMRRSMVDEDPEAATPGFDTMTDLVDVEFGRALSSAGGMGLSASLVQALDKLSGMGHSEPASAAALPGLSGSGDWPSVTETDPQEASPVAVSGTIDAAPGQPSLDGPITSAFGWRRDPLSGSPGFHKGVDVAMAYGQDVRAAAAGTVVFVGENGGYGNMVAVRHSDGRETRYAHLSVPEVQVGDAVDEGGVLGKSGSSGRSTGPHLHFEVLFNGRPVDPATLERH